MNKQITALMCMIFVMLMIPMVSGLTYMQDTNIDLKITCVDNDDVLCDENTNCSINVLRPNGTLMIYQNMSRLNNQYNYTLNDTQTSIIGTYSATILCDGSSDDGYTQFDFDITESGFDYQPEYVLPVIIFMIFLILLFAFLSYTLFHHEYQFFGYLSGLMVIIVLLSGIALLQNMVSGNGGTGIIESNFIVLTYIFRAFLMGGLIWLIVRVLQEVQKSIRGTKGMEVEDD